MASQLMSAGESWRIGGNGVMAYQCYRNMASCQLAIGLSRGDKWPLAAGETGFIIGVWPG
jgi:hypothetical protein